MDTIEKFDVENDDLLEFKRETSNFKNDTIIRAVGDFSLANEPSQELINFIGHHENSDRPFILDCYRSYHKKNGGNTTDNIKDFEKEFNYFNYIKQSFTDKIPEKYRESFETKVKDKIISGSGKYFTEIVQGEIIDTIRKIDDKDLLNFYGINYDESSVRKKAFIVKFYVKSGRISKDQILDYVNGYETLQDSLSQSNYIDEGNSGIVLSLKTIDEDNSISESDKFEHDLGNITKLFNKNIDESYINNTVLGSIQIDKQYYSSLNSYFYNNDFKNLVIKNNGVISLKDLESLGKIGEAIKLNVRTKYEEDFVRNMFETLSINKTTNRDELKKAIESQPNNELKSYLLGWKKNIEDKPIEEILGEWLYTNGYIITDMSFDDTKLRQVSEQQSRRLMSNKRFIERLKEKNRQINKSLPKSDNENLFVVEGDEGGDSMGTQLAKDAGIGGKDLEGYSSISLKLSKEEMNQIEIDALPIAWHNLIEKKGEIGDYFNDIDVRKMYNFETKAFNQTLLNEKIAEIIDKSGDDIDVTNLRTSIEGFYSEMEDAISELTKNYVEAKKTSFDDSKVNAIGGVIDSISSIFDKISNSNGLCEGFKYAEKDPISLDGDLLTIKGLLNGEKTKICYNLRSGELFMNSFIKESNNPQMIKIGDRQDEKDGYPEADKNIGKIEKFEDIIPDIETSTEIVNNQPIDEVNYNRQIAGMDYVSNGGHSIQTDPDFHSSSPGTPQSQTNARDIFDKMKLGNERGKKRKPLRLRFDKRRQPDDKKNMIRDKMRSIQKRPPEDVFLGNNMENNKLIFQNKMKEAIDLIGDSVKNYSDLQTKKNDIIIKFLKTFNIVNSQMGIKSMEFHEPSNIYWLLHIIENSEADQLDKFSDFMNIASKYGGLTRGENILPNQQENMMTKEIRESNENDEHNARGIIKKSLANFGNETSILGNQGTLKFDGTHSLSMAQLIIDNLIDNPKDKANSKLNTGKINNFLLSLDRNVSLDHNDGINNLEEGNPDEELEEKLNYI